MNHFSKEDLMQLVSIVIPLYNEQENVAELYSELAEVSKNTEFDWEFVFVDDGSTDNTISRLTEISQGDHRVSIICFRRNFGQTAAMAAG